ncbi:Tyrosine--tRNA ligase cytoplasmic [Recurvomyces mirabilis]|uniref:Tyrosine--tRNA ligase n=1 Tax=Recurvomyces mirabilis TaxID=574656 RepID=A0AAE0WMS5_9PEZI|nr:Tyrosine--tRNA ligase cytoplasmic [Recurvomyces mirabilis]KAK5151270.1 Tyrosine--tRNA ligase cytoplasmic [Recurvomyces mirabilis]
MAESTSAQLASTPQEKFALIKDNLQEVLNPEIIEEILQKNERPLRIYWGTATTGKPHCGYFVPMLKIAQFLAAGSHVTILLADVHGFLDNLKAPIELVQERVKYYRYCITALLQAVGVDITRLEFVTGSDYQYSSQYVSDIYKLSTQVSVHDASKAGSDVVKQVDSPPLSSHLYPLMQALDEEHLNVDAQFGGVDQRKIFTLAVETLPRIGYRKRAHLMNPLIPGLQEGGKMSSSDPDSKIDLIEPAEIVKKKLKKAFCPPKQVVGNGVISFVEFVLLPASALKNKGVPKFSVPRRDAETLEYTCIQKLKDDYLSDILSPQSLKPAVTEALLEILEPIRRAFEEDKEWQAVETRAYPPPPAPEKKKKKEKNLGSRFPGGAGKGGEGAVEVKPDGHVEGDGALEVSVGVKDLSLSGEEAKA